MKPILLALILILIVGCASKSGKSTEATKSLNEKWNPRVGAATKNDFVEEYGKPEWCQQGDNGEETCRFYRKIQTKWIGEKKEKKNYDVYDQVVADFDTDGKLRSFKSDAQR